jgi:phage-related minor tail protein
MSMSVQTTTIVVAYPVTIAQIQEQLAPLAEVSFETSYAEGRKALAACRDLRGDIEERRKFLKADSLAYGREVDRVAKELTSAVEAIEEVLKGRKLLVDKAKEAAKRAAEEAERAKVEAEIRAKREAEEAVLREQRQAEEAALKAERAALLKERQAAEAAALLQRQEAEKAALKAAEEREELERERQAARQELAELRAERERQAREKAAQELAERKIAEAEQERIHKLEWEAEQKRRIAALAPDLDKLRTFAASIRGLVKTAPEVDDDQAAQCLVHACQQLIETAELLEELNP